MLGRGVRPVKAAPGTVNAAALDNPAPKAGSDDRFQGERPQDSAPIHLQGIDSLRTIAHPELPGQHLPYAIALGPFQPHAAMPANTFTY